MTYLRRERRACALLESHRDGARCLYAGCSEVCGKLLVWMDRYKASVWWDKLIEGGLVRLFERRGCLSFNSHSKEHK